MSWRLSTDWLGYDIQTGVIMNYELIYKKLIQKAKTQSNTGYTESHHILPRSMGGSDLKSNLVNLTPRQHYIAHRLLEKITKGTPNYYKMLKAVTMMGCGGTITKHIPTSRTYNLLVKQYAILRKQSIHSHRFGNGVFSVTGLYIYYSKAQKNDHYFKDLVNTKDVGWKTKKATLHMLFALYFKGYNKFSGVGKLRATNIDYMYSIGFLREVAGSSGRLSIVYELTDVAINYFEGKLLVGGMPPKVTPLYNYLVTDETTKGTRGLGRHKEDVIEYNKSNSSNGMLKKLILIDKEYFTKTY